MSEDSFDDEEDFDIEELSEAEEMLTDLELQCSGQDTVQESRSCKTQNATSTLVPQNREDENFGKWYAVIWCTNQSQSLYIGQVKQ